jgi:RNA polymerase primary sigma factor
MASIIPLSQPASLLNLSAIATELDVPAAEFDVRAQELVAEARGKPIRCRLDLPERATRQSELTLARSLEFLRLRVRDALLRAGCSEDQLTELPNVETAISLAGGLPKTKTGRFARGAVAELEALRDLYVERSSYLVGVLVERYTGLGLDRDDLTQEGYLGLLRGIESYDWRRGVRFSTYTKYWVQERILKALYDQSRTVRLPVWVQKIWGKMARMRSESPDVENSAISERLDLSERRVRRIEESFKGNLSLDATREGDGGGSWADSLVDEKTLEMSFPSDATNLKAALKTVLDELTAREATVLCRRFGLVGDDPEPLKDIGKDLGVSAERVRQIQESALQRLRGHPRLAQLRACLS